MIFATRSANRDKLNELCIPGIRASMVGADYNHMTRASTSEDIFPTLDSFIHRAREQKSTEALVLLHDDLELRDPAFASKMRHAFKVPDVAIVGCIGARGVRSLSWWEGSPRFGHAVDGLHGVYEWGFGEGDPCDVDSVDGMLLILSPWAIHNLELAGLGYCGLHGYAEELCFQARARGKRVVVSRFGLMHHSKGGIAGDQAAWLRSDANFRRRWVPDAGRKALREIMQHSVRAQVIDT